MTKRGCWWGAELSVSPIRSSACRIFLAPTQKRLRAPHLTKRPGGMMLSNTVVQLHTPCLCSLPHLGIRDSKHLPVLYMNAIGFQHDKPTKYLRIHR